MHIASTHHVLRGSSRDKAVFLHQRPVHLLFVSVSGLATVSLDLRPLAGAYGRGQGFLSCRLVGWVREATRCAPYRGQESSTAPAHTVVETVSANKLGLPLTASLSTPRSAGSAASSDGLPYPGARCRTAGPPRSGTRGQKCRDGSAWACCFCFCSRSVEASALVAVEAPRERCRHSEAAFRANWAGAAGPCGNEKWRRRAPTHPGPRPGEGEGEQ